MRLAVELGSLRSFDRAGGSRDEMIVLDGILADRRTLPLSLAVVLMVQRPPDCDRLSQVA